MSVIRNLYACLIFKLNETVGYENRYCFISIKFDFEKMWIICRNFVAGVTILTIFVGIFVRILILLVFSKSCIQYLCQWEFSDCKALMPIKVVPVKNDYFLHPKLEVHRY